jgi:hypothetical protein
VVVVCVGGNRKRRWGFARTRNQTHEQGPIRYPSAAKNRLTILVAVCALSRGLGRLRNEEACARINEGCLARQRTGELEETSRRNTRHIADRARYSDVRGRASGLVLVATPPWDTTDANAPTTAEQRSRMYAQIWIVTGFRTPRPWLRFRSRRLLPETKQALDRLRSNKGPPNSLEMQDSPRQRYRNYNYRPQRAGWTPSALWPNSIRFRCSMHVWPW